mmetsp:Transcript_20597/g.48383  ORF Transcript_20597/g.48383 Transcript_20597/m.48383 type:complete len:117 (-) Transcript_20597:25-375(-)
MWWARTWPSDCDRADCPTANAGMRGIACLLRASDVAVGGMSPRAMRGSRRAGDTTRLDGDVRGISGSQQLRLRLEETISRRSKTASEGAGVPFETNNTVLLNSWWCRCRLLEVICG